MTPGSDVQGLQLRYGTVTALGDVPLAVTLALCGACLLPGAALTWILVRDIPIRPRTA